jgi:predicted Zn-dependent peptidase
MISSLGEGTSLKPLEIVKHVLGNGLRVAINPYMESPVVSVAVYYDVGSRNERFGRTGFAHLFEHMMFQGSANVGKAEHFQFIMKAGGTMNGTTSSERTNYYETLPADQLPLALWLEADRMKSLAVNQENLDNQREAVKEEKRLRYDNQPYGQVFDMITSMVYTNFANAHSTIGSMDDLDAATVGDLQDFFKLYYAPSNAVLAISGAVDPVTCIELVEKYFGEIPSGENPPVLDVSEGVGVSERHRDYFDQLAPLPAFLRGWKIPDRTTRDHKAAMLGGRILFDGDSSRLYQKLVKGDESVVQLFGFTDERRGPSAIYMGAIPKPGFTTDSISAVMDAEIADLAINGPSDSEMEKLRNQILNDSVRMRQSSLARAQQMAESWLYDGDPRSYESEINELLSIDGNEIKLAISKFIKDGESALLNVVPSAPSVGEVTTNVQ